MARLRQNLSKLSVGVRHSGKCALDRLKERKYTFWFRMLAVTLSEMSPADPKWSTFVIAARHLLTMRQKITYTSLLTRPEKVLRTNVTIDSLSQSFCRESLRFLKQHLPALRRALGFTAEWYTLDNGCSIRGEELFLFMLHRMSYPRRLIDMQQMWGRENSQLSRMFNAAVKFTYLRHNHKLKDYLTTFFASRLLTYRDAVRAKIARVNRSEDFNSRYLLKSDTDKTCRSYSLLRIVLTFSSSPENSEQFAETLAVKS